MAIAVASAYSDNKNKNNQNKNNANKNKNNKNNNNKTKTTVTKTTTTKTTTTKYNNNKYNNNSNKNNISVCPGRWLQQWPAPTLTLIRRSSHTTGERCTIILIGNLS